MTARRSIPCALNADRPCAPIEAVPCTEECGTTIRFQADPEIFETTVYDYETLLKLREAAFLNAAVRITLRDEREGELR